jgi:type II secretory pathway pseudopilin PulG
LKRSDGSINSFFIEIIIVICFFAVSAAVTLQLFAAANSRAQRSSDLSAAVVQAQDVAERMKGVSSPEELAQTLQAAKSISPDGTEHLRLDYDRAWNRISQGTPFYTVEVVLTKDGAESGVLLRADISVFRRQATGESKLYTLSADRYFTKIPANID